jgi:hypothetical protein
MNSEGILGCSSMASGARRTATQDNHPLAKTLYA